MNRAIHAWKLSRRQREIATLIAAGCSDREIGARLGISHNTVGSHLRWIYVQLHIRTREDLARWARRKGLAA